MSLSNPFNALFNTLHTVNDVDEAAQWLSAQWQRSFSPAPKLDGKKKAKLRDMVCNLAGYTNGFKSFLDAIKVPTIALDAFSLPDEVMVNFDYEIETLCVGSDVSRMTSRHGDPETLYEDSEDCLAVIYHSEEMHGEMVSGLPILGKNKPLLDVSLWVYLLNHYTPKMIHICMPRIDKYGVMDEASPQGMQAYLKDIGLHMDRHDIDEVLHSTDRGDDGCASFAIHWVKR
jgi:hypothetical protein